MFTSNSALYKCFLLTYRVHQDLPDSRGMGIVDTSIGCLPSHPHTSTLKEVSKVLPQVSGVPVHFPPLRTGHSPPGFYNDCKGSEAYGPLQRSHISSIPGRLADQVPVSGGSPSEHLGSRRSNQVLGMDHKSGKVRTETYSGVFVHGLQIPCRFSPCKTHSRDMAQTSAFDPTTQVKTCFDCKMFDVANWEKQEKRLHINVLELKAVSLALRQFKDQCQNQTVLVATDNSTVVAYINKQGGTHSAEMCALLWKIMTWCHHYHITLKARHIPGCLNVMVDLLSRSNQVQSTEWSLHPQVFKQICQKWFTIHVDLFAIHLNHKLPRYVSPIPDQKAWDIDVLHINWMGLTAYAYPPTALLHRVIQKIRQYHCLIILIAPGWLGMPWFWDQVQLSTEIPLQLPVSTTLLKQSHNYVFHSNPQHLNLHAWCLGVVNSKNKASLWRGQRELLHLKGHQQEPSTNQNGPYLINGAEKIRWISPLHLKQAPLEH